MTEVDEQVQAEPVSKFSADDWQRSVGERRRAVAVLPDAVIANILELPDGARVRSFQVDFARQAVLVLLEGPAFEPTPRNAEPRQLAGDWEYDAENQRLRYLPWRPEAAA